MNCLLLSISYGCSYFLTLSGIILYVEPPTTTVVDNSTLIPIGILVTGVSISALLGWRASRIFFQIQELEKKVERLEEKLRNGGKK